MPVDQFLQLVSIKIFPLLKIPTNNESHNKQFTILHMINELSFLWSYFPIFPFYIHFKYNRYFLLVLVLVLILALYSAIRHSYLFLVPGEQKIGPVPQEFLSKKEIYWGIVFHFLKGILCIVFPGDSLTYFLSPGTIFKSIALALLFLCGLSIKQLCYTKAFNNIYHFCHKS